MAAAQMELAPPTPPSARPFRHLHSSLFIPNFSRALHVQSRKAAASKPMGLTVVVAAAVAAAKKAVAVLKGNSQVEGVVTLLQQQDDGPTTVNARVTGLTPGLHGFHLLCTDGV